MRAICYTVANITTFLQDENILLTFANLQSYQYKRNFVIQTDLTTKIKFVIRQVRWRVQDKDVLENSAYCTVINN